MAKDTITLTMQEYNPAMYAKVQQMRERYAVLMNLKGQRLKMVTKKGALYRSPERQRTPAALYAG